MNPQLKFQVAVITLTRVVINTMFRFVYPFLAVFSRGLGVDLAAISLALSGRSFTGAIGPLIAPIADARGRRFGMLFGLTLFTVGIGLVAIWPNYPTFVIMLLLTSFGKSVFDPTIQAYLGDQVAYEKRGFAIGLTEFGWSLSFILGVPLMGLLIARLDWRAPFPVLAVLGLASLWLISRFIPRDERVAARPLSITHNLRSVLAMSSARRALVVPILMSAANEMINLIFGVWMETSFGLQVAALGAASLVIGLAELSGETLVTGLSDRIGKVRSVGGGLLLNGLAALTLPLLGHTVGGALAGLFLFYLTFEFTIVSFIPLMSEVAPQARATFLALNVACFMIGRALAALVASQVYAGGIWASALVAVGINLLAILGLNTFQRSINWRFKA